MGSSYEKALMVKKKHGFVDGTILKPDEGDPEYEDWMSANSMVTLWIRNTIEPKVRRTLGNKEDPRELWEEIKEHFSKGNGPRIQEIKAELANCKQGGMTIIEYYGNLQMLWEDLMNYDQTPVCKCGHCTCNVGAELEKKKEEDKIHQFLLGLNDEIYGGVRTSIVTTDLLPSLNQVYSKVKSVERIRTVVRGREQAMPQSAFVAREETVFLAKREDRDKLVCTACKKAGHLVDACFQVIGYPEWWGERSRGRGGGRGTGRGRSTSVRANAVMELGGNKPSDEAEKSGFTCLSKEQWTTLVKLLEDQKQQPRLNGPFNKEPDWCV